MKYLILSFLLVQNSWACEDAKKIYKICSKQQKLYDDASANAKKNEKLLLVTFGFEACPWCQSIHKIFTAAENQTKLAAYQLVTIEAKSKELDGKQVLEKLNKKKVKVDGYPFLAIVNPKNGKTAFINTADLEANTETTKGHDAAKLFGAIDKAARNL